MKVGEIKTRVRAAIDELEANNSKFIDEATDSKVLDRIIVNSIYPSLFYVLTYAPNSMLNDSIVKKYDTVGKISIDASSKVATVTLPKNFLRLISARMKSWKYAPTPVSEDSIEALMQNDEYAHGTTDRPVTVMIHDDGELKLQMNRAKDANDEAIIHLIEKPDVKEEELQDEDDNIEIPIKAEAAFIYHIAALSTTSRRDAISTTLMQISQNYLGISQQQSTYSE
jgi:hypothetical protein